MKINTLLLFSIFGLFISCKKDENNPSNSSGSTMISQANGFEFVGAFEEKDAPIYYKFPDEFHIDDYLDNDRVLVMCESTFENPPKRIKWYVLNYKNGSLTKSFSSNDNFGPDWGNFMQFAFDHENFKIQSWHTTDKYFYQIDTLTKETSYFITNVGSLQTRLIGNHLLRQISEISFWPYNTITQKDEPQFLLTGELSAMRVIDYYFDSNYEQEKGNSIYTGYFYPSNDGNWIGISKGNQRLDTLLIDKEAPIMYNQMICKTYVEKVGNKMYLAFIKNKFNPNTDQDLSMYELTIGENKLKPLFVNMDLPPDENYEIKAFRNGKLIIFPTANATEKTPYTISVDGTKSNYLIPVANNAGLKRHVFGKKFHYIIMTNGAGEKRLEFYKKDLFK